MSLLNPDSYNSVSEMVPVLTYEYRKVEEVIMRRVQAALEACEGIPTEALEKGFIKDLLEMFDYLMKELKQPLDDSYKPPYFSLALGAALRASRKLEKKE